MALAFLQERRYAPYAKWFSSAFSRLAAAAEMGPTLREALVAPTFVARQEALLRLYQIAAGRHNALGVTPPVAATMRPFAVGINDAVRPFPVLGARRFVKACQDAITEEAVRSLRLVGSIDQFAATDLVSHFTDWPRHLARVYDRHLTPSHEAEDDGHEAGGA
jgi:hypothetical protein